MKGFREFVLRGNVVDLAVGVVIGAAFATLVGQFGASFLSPLLGLVLPAEPGKGAGFTVDGQFFAVGAFLTAVVTFLITAVVVYVGVVVPMNALVARFRAEPEATSPTRSCTECLSKIPVAARRCAFCTAAQHSGTG